MEYCVHIDEHFIFKCEYSISNFCSIEKLLRINVQISFGKFPSFCVIAFREQITYVTMREHIKHLLNVIVNHSLNKFVKTTTKN